MSAAPWPLDGADLLSQVRRIIWLHEGADRLGAASHTHPKDVGGRTKAGLTWRCYSEDYLRLPKGARCPVDQFDALTLDAIVEIMLEVFAMRSNLWGITDDRLRFVVVDAAILFGAPRASMFLQLALGVHADGVVGRQTLAALDRHPQIDLVRERVANARNEYHARRVVARPDQAAFLEGWIARTGRCLTWRAAAVLLALLSLSAVAQDDWEPVTGIPVSSWGYTVPIPVGTSR